MCGTVCSCATLLSSPERAGSRPTEVLSHCLHWCDSAQHNATFTQLWMADAMPCVWVRFADTDANKCKSSAIWIKLNSLPLKNRKCVCAHSIQSDTFTFTRTSVLSTIHTKNNNYKVNLISVHTSAGYCSVHNGIVAYGHRHFWIHLTPEQRAETLL